jgi:predicted dehydrogenase
MDKIKVGIIGTGFSATSHLEALRRLNDVEVIAIAGSSQSKADQIAGKYGIPMAYSDAQDLINDADVDVVHNCTPNDLHFSINRAVLLAGKHLLSEKPLAMTSEQSQELVELAKGHHGVSGLCFNYRFYPMIAEAKESIIKNKYGKVNIIYGGYVQDWCLNIDDYSWRMDPEKNGPSRAIADIGSHWCDTIQHILGKRITEVLADLKTVHPVRKKPKNQVSTFSISTDDEKKDVQITTEDYGSVLVHFDDGIQGVFTVSQVSAGRKNKLYFDIAAEKATISWDQEEPNQLWIGKRNEPNQVLMKDPSLLSSQASTLAHYPGGHQEGWPDGMKNLFVDFYDAVNKKKMNQGDDSTSSFASIEDGHYIMQLIESILESHQKKKWIKLGDKEVVK